MKAWHVHGGEPADCSLLIFAETGNRARMLGAQHAAWDFDGYINTKAWRAPKWDAYAMSEKFIDENTDLPAGAPPFYSDDEIYP